MALLKHAAAVVVRLTVADGARDAGGQVEVGQAGVGGLAAAIVAVVDTLGRPHFRLREVTSAGEVAVRYARYDETTGSVVVVPNGAGTYLARPEVDLAEGEAAVHDGFGLVRAVACDEGQNRREWESSSPRIAS